MGFLYDEQSRLETPAPGPRREANSSAAPVHLPKIQLPSFNGRIEEWETFRDVFSSMIHQNPSLTTVQKMHYLMTSVKEEAKRALAGFAITGANYSIAWDLLSKRYEHKRVLAQHHMASLARGRPLTSESASGLQTVLDRITNAREGLRSLGRPVEHWSDWLVYFATDGLDPSTRRDWEKVIGGNNAIPTFEDISVFITGRIRALQSVKPTMRSAPSISFQAARRDAQSSRNPYKSNARVLTTYTTKNACLACKKDHYLGQCPTLMAMTHDKRINTIRHLRLCFNCLRAGHLQNQCTSKGRCQRCNSHHHTILHPSSTNKRMQSEPTDTPTSKRSQRHEVGSSGPRMEMTHNLD